MISRQELAGALGRFALLRWFPANNADALAALAEILKETCPDDAELAALVREILQTTDEWTGPASVRRAYDSLLEKRRATENERLRKERVTEGRRERDLHEATCPGYYVHFNDADKTVSVSFCNAHWGEHLDFIRCRNGDALHGKDRGFCEQLLMQELAERPGWLSETDYFFQAFKRRRAGRGEAHTAEQANGGIQ